MDDTRVEGFPLSPPQARLWSVAGGDAVAFRTRCTVEIAGSLDPRRLARALAGLIGHHEILRTSFRLLPGMTVPLQVIAGGETAVEMEVEPGWWRGGDAGALLDRLPSPPADRPWAPRYGLAPVQDDLWLLVLDLPALASDEPGLRYLVRELTARYADPDHEPGETLQVADVAEWLNDLLTAEDTAPGRDYWGSLDTRRHLAVELPGAVAGPTAQELLAVEARDLSPELWERIEEVAPGPEAFLLTCWQVVLARRTGRWDSLVAVEIDGRRFAELEKAPGLLARSVPVILEAAPRAPFQEALAGVRAGLQEAETWLESFVWQRPEGFPFGFAYRPPAPVFDAGGLRWRLREEQSRIDRADLALTARHGRDDPLRLELAYDPRRWPAAEMARLLRQLHNVIAGAASLPGAALEDLSLLDDGERRLVVELGQSGEEELAAEGCIHHRFEGQAARVPQRVAVVCGAEHLTYEALDGRASRLAGRLRRRGAAPEVVVALCGERSPALVAGLLGILKAGAAYLPLEPAQPPARLEGFIAWSGAPILLAGRGLPDRLGEAEVQRLDLEEVPAQGTAGPPASAVFPANLAYVIYTSGSTGAPKGVAVEHRQLVAYVDAAVRRLGIGEGCSFASVSTLAADLGNTAVFPALATGGRLHLVPSAVAADAEAAGELFACRPVDLLKIVPSHLAALLASDPRGRVLPRRWLVLGGEAAGEELLVRLRRLQPPCAVHNHYGPTETTVGVTTHRLSPEETPAARPPIGRPLGGSRIRVLDRRLRAIPLWVEGELCVGGGTVTRGYRASPGATAERFVPDPLAARPGSRLYRTGDLALCAADGLFHLRGRMDEQVKIRGFRIEPVEVAAVLERHPQVERAVVLARGDSDLRLVAYVVPRAGEEPGADALRDHLRSCLPEPMMPAAYVFLRVLPLTENGKLDRRALPEPGDGDGGVGSAAPRNPVEEVLTEIWADVLGHPRLGIDADFFALGGHSLLVTRAVSRMRAAFGVELHLAAVFDRPTVAQLAPLVEAALGRGEGMVESPVERVPRRRDLPLSFAQQRLWFLDQLDPASAAYHIASRLQLRGDLDVRALHRALETLVERHEPLRTSFPARQGTAVQRIGPPGGLVMPTVDLSRMASALHLPMVVDLARREARRPFDLARGPLLRTRLLRLEPERHVALFTLHHVISDGWSMGILIDELGELYQAYSRGRAPSLPPLAVQYADYSIWQRRHLQGAQLERLLAYWRDRLDGMPPSLELPTDRPRPRTQSFAGATVEALLPAELVAAARTLARDSSATLFMVTLAAFSALLHRSCGAGEVAVGSPIANRNRLEIERLVGFFVNALVLRIDLAGDPTFRDLVRRVRQISLGAYVHQDLPFEALVDELQPRRDLSRTPLFQVAFVLQNAPRPPLDLPGLVLKPLEVELGTAKFDLTLTLTEVGDGLHAALEYATSLFERTTVLRMLRRYRALLRQAVAEPSRPLASLSLLAPAERQQLMAEWGRPLVVPDPGMTVDALFREQARRRTDAVALSCGEQWMSYGGLDAEAVRVAGSLRSRGVGPETVVGLCLERSIELPVAILGVLMAGGAYLPLDPAYPAERLRFMMEDAGLRVVLTGSGLAVEVPATAAEVLPLDRLPAEAAGTVRAETGKAQAQNLAYVLYTSGSTGRPKGVQVCHQQVVRLFTAAAEQGLRFTRRDVWTLFHSYAFDFSVWEMWGALLHGGRLVVVPYWLSRSPQALLRLLAEERVTVLNQTPSAFGQLCAALESWEGGAETTLTRVIFGGEALELSTLEPWFERFGDRRPRLVNMYGITETTVHVTYRSLGRRDLEEGQASVIGRPLADLGCYLVERDLRLAPLGTSGEICVGGAGPARGYLGRPSITAERFVPDPFSDLPGARLYRSGDLARHRSGGGLEYLGRIDHQVKVRGFRIELGEVQAALLRHPGLREAVVVARDDGPGTTRLVAYLVPADGAAPSVSELQRSLKTTLPEHMVPAAFVTLEELPLTANGKLDRRALPAPAASREGLERPFTAPRNPVEARLATIWKEVLGIAAVGVSDNFFELGGDSILSIQIVARAAQAGLRLQPRDLFQHQTVAELAMVAQELVPAAAEAGEAVVGDVPLTPIQHWFFDQRLPDPQHWNQTVRLSTRRRLKVWELTRIVRHLLAHHDALRLRFSPTAGAWRQWSAVAGGRVPAAVCDLSGLTARDRRKAFTATAAGLQGSLDLTRGPLLRVVFFHLAGGDGRLLFVAHHLVVDGVSWRVLLGDLESCLRRLDTRRPLVLPPKTTSFRDWSLRLAAQARSEPLTTEAEYWLDAGRRSTPPLPVDHPGGENREELARTLTRSLDPAQTNNLLERAPGPYNTRVEELLLASLAMTFRAWTGESRLRVDLEGHGREEELVGDVDLSRTVGWLTTIYPLCLDLRSARRPQEVICEVKEQVRGVPRRGIGYGLLRYLAGGEVGSALARLPPAGVRFNYLGRLDRVLDPTGPFDIAPEDTGPPRSPRGDRPHPLAVKAQVAGGRLEVSWSFSPALHEPATVERLAEGYIVNLCRLIEHSLSPDAGGYTPSDFPLAGLDRAALDRVMAQVEFEAR